MGLGRALAARSDVALTAFVDSGTAWPAGPSGSRPHVESLRARQRTPRLALELPIRARLGRLDILHVQYVMPPVAGLPVAVAIHDLSFEDRPDLFPVATRWRLQAAIRVSAQRAHVVLALSEFTRARILHHYGLDPARVMVVRAGIEPPDPPDPTTDGVARDHLKRLGLPDRFVLHVGDLIPRKNVPRLVEAVVRLRRDGAGDLGIVLAGQTGRDLYLVEAAIAGATGPREQPWAHRLGYVSAMTLDALYRVAEVVAQPSLYEGFGLPVLEAMARGAVVVTSTTTALGEVVGDAALLADPEDIDALTAVLGRAIGDEAERARLRQAGPQRATGFSWTHAADQTVAAYRNALDR